MLGFELVNDQAMGPGMRWERVRPPGAATSITPVTWFESMTLGSVKGTVLETDDLDEEVARLRSLGVEIAGDVQDAPWGRFATFDDPDGNGLVLQQTATGSPRYRGPMDSHDWDERYQGTDLVWTATPNQFLVSEVEGLTPGTAVDLACGEGRNSVWLAEQGWAVTGVDFSAVGLAKGAKLAEARGVDVTWVEASVADWVTPPGGVDLVVVCYLQLPEPQRTAALTKAADAVAPGGMLLVIAHDKDNLIRGVGGPQDPAALYAAPEVVDVAVAAGLHVDRAGQVLRSVVTDAGTREAVDTLVRASRMTGRPGELK